MFKFFCCLSLILLGNLALAHKHISSPGKANFYNGNNIFIQYIGRIDNSHPLYPRFWAPGVYVNVRFRGTFCGVIINDEVAGGTNHNYLEIIVDDGKPMRIQTTKKTDTITIANGLKNGIHHFTLCKDTESGIGYIEFAGVLCVKLMPPPPLPVRRIEFVGNSITCGTGMDQSKVPCHTGLWHDQHNAYMSYGALTSRKLKAQWHLTSVSGIGLMHSCCNLDMVMGQVFDKVNLRANAIEWDFKKYLPDVITICLGQNDGIQDSTRFCDNYRDFIKTVRGYYPEANIICLTSPMADNSLKAFLQKTLTSLVNKINNDGDKKVSFYFFKKRYHHGCDEHPDMEEHEQIATELTADIKKVTGW